MLGNHLLGLYEKALPPELTWEERLRAVTELGFDYLRDNMVTYKDNMVQPCHAYTVVDDIRCHNWYNQFKDGFRQFEDRAQDDLQPVILQEACEFSHVTKSFSLTYPLFYLHWTEIAIYFAGYFQKTNFFCDILSLI